MQQQLFPKALRHSEYCAVLPVAHDHQRKYDTSFQQLIRTDYCRVHTTLPNPPHSTLLRPLKSSFLHPSLATSRGGHPPPAGGDSHNTVRTSYHIRLTPDNNHTAPPYCHPGKEKKKNQHTVIKSYSIFGNKQANQQTNKQTKQYVTEKINIIYHKSGFKKPSSDAGIWGIAMFK